MIKTDEFITARLHYKDYGVYTKFPKGSRSYRKFWDEEKRRCLEGYNPGFDYIPGYFYFYLNYCPIQIVVPRKNSEGLLLYNEDGTIQGDRIEDFPKVWDGDYQYFHYLEEAEKAGKHGVVLKTRGRGYSFKGGSMLNRNYFLEPRSKSYAIASAKEYLIKDGVLTKAWENMSFIDQHTAWSKRRHGADLPMHKRASYKINQDGVDTEKGYLSEIIGVTIGNDPNRARGKRGKLILWEEAGKLPGLLQAWNIARSSLEQGKVVYGLMVAFGTGGTEGADFEGLQELFDNPKGYNILPVNNTWEEGMAESKCGFFMPECMNLEGYMDQDGNSNTQLATKIILQDRKVVLEETKDTMAYKRFIAEKPLTPKEAMMKLEGNIFPTQDLLGVLARLEFDPKYEQGLSKGFFTINQEGKVEFELSNTARILYNFPVKKEDNKNAPCILYEQPYTDQDGNIPYGIYIGGIDPYDFDKGTSLGSCFIMNKLTGRVVAEYTARPETAKEFYEQTRRMLLYYNARALYENEKKGIFDYFESQGSLYLLCEEPKLIHDIIKNPGASRKYGIRMPEAIKRYGEGLIYQWLIREYDPEKNIKNYHKVRSVGLLKELVQYDPDPKKNFDRVMSFMCLLYQLEEERNYIPNTDDRTQYTPMHKRDFFRNKAIQSNLPKDFNPNNLISRL